MPSIRAVAAFLAIICCAAVALAQPLAPVHQWASEAYASSEYTPTGWSAQQATGAPNTDRDGDLPTAWASATADRALETLELVYAMPVVPSAVNVRKTCNPGFVIKIEAYDYRDEDVIGGRLPQDAEGKWIVLWEGGDKTVRSPGVFSPPSAGGEGDYEPHPHHRGHRQARMERDRRR